MAPSLDLLPVEILELIADFFMWDDNINSQYENESTATIAAFRLVCRRMEAAVHRKWLDVFTARHVDLTPTKLRRLNEVTAVPEIAGVINILRVRCTDDPRFSDSEKTMLYRAGAIRDLVSAFSKLKRIRTILFLPSTAKRHISVDFSNELYIIALAVQKCGQRPKCIFGRRDNLTLTKFHPMRQLAQCFSELKTFHVNVCGRSTPLEEAKAFASGVDLMQSLTKIKVDFSPVCDRMMREMANSVRLPCLEEVDLSFLACDIRDLTRFLCKHTDSLTLCRLQDVKSSERTDSISGFNRLLRKLRDAFHLIYFEICHLTMRYGFVICFFYEREIEDDYLLVSLSDDVLFRGLHSVRKGLTDMLRCMVLKVVG